MNLFDHLEAVATDGASLPWWSARSLSEPHRRFDAKLISRVDCWQDRRRAREALERVEKDPAVERLEPDGREVWVRFSESCMSGLGERFAEPVPVLPDNRDLLGGQRFVVNFWCANATKALHVGHLRNLAVGNGLAGVFSESGAQVERHSLICDIGRSMGEAMAGVARSDPQTGPELEKADHFVGRCYLDYLRAAQDRVAPDVGSREIALGGEGGALDGADELTLQLMAGDADARELWHRTRSWVMQGQLETLARLGVEFERVYYESDYMAKMRELEELGLRQGVIHRDGDGVVVFPTGLSELEEMPLVRSDGVPTQHMRSLAFWIDPPDLDGAFSIQVSGAEWVSHVSCRRRLAAALSVDGAAVATKPTQDVFHGMVAVEKRAMASSVEGALLIDDLLDWLEAQIDSDQRARRVLESHPSPERVPAQVALACFSLQQVGKTVEFDPLSLLDESRSPGWALACARAASGRPVTPADLRAAPGDPDYRYALVQSEMYRRHLLRAIGTRDLETLGRYAFRLAGWYLREPRAATVERVVSATLGQAAVGLGLEPLQSERVG
jgi:arginyl-tRNA synthetase